MKLFGMMCATLLAACGTILAQGSADLLKFHFDEPITVAGAQLPAGNFTVRVLDSNNGNTVLSIRSESGAQVLALSNPVAEPEARGTANSNVTFRKAGNNYSLNTVWMSDSVGFQLLQPEQ